MPRPTPSDYVTSPKAMMAYATVDVVRPFVLPKGDDGMKRSTSFDPVCSPKAMMACHARCCRLCVQSKGGDVMPRPTLPSVCAVQGR